MATRGLQPLIYLKYDNICWLGNVFSSDSAALSSEKSVFNDKVTGITNYNYINLFCRLCNRVPSVESDRRLGLRNENLILESKYP
jgi:hypothetical protein